MVLVVGMHRSGTSATTRFLNILGLGLPPELVPFAENNNSLGFWEPRKMVEINERLLRHMSMTWHSTGPMPENWQATREVGQLSGEAGEFVDSLSDEPIVLKDPRLCRLLPFWNGVFASRGIETHAIMPYRHPLEVGLSLGQRDSFSMSKGLVLWLRHILEAELHTRSCKTRMFLKFDDLLTKPEAVFRRLQATLGGRLLSDWSSVSSDVSVSFPGSQKHFNVSEGALRSVDTVFRELHHALGQGERTLKHLSDRVRVRIENADTLFGELLNMFEWTINNLGERVRILEGPSADGSSTFIRRTLEATWVSEISRSEYFDAEWYLEQNPDVAAAGMDPVVHFVRYGWREGRDPSASFKLRQYVEANPEVRDSGANPLIHFLHSARNR